MLDDTPVIDIDECLAHVALVLGKNIELVRESRPFDSFGHFAVDTDGRLWYVLYEPKGGDVKLGTITLHRFKPQYKTIPKSLPYEDEVDMSFEIRYSLTGKVQPFEG